MNPTLVAVFSAALVAVVVAGVGIALVLRAQRRRDASRDDDQDFVSSASRLAEVQVSPFGGNQPHPGPNPPAPDTPPVTDPPGGETPVWAAGPRSDAPSPAPLTDDLEPMFPTPRAPAEAVPDQPEVPVEPAPPGEEEIVPEPDHTAAAGAPPHDEESEAEADPRREQEAEPAGAPLRERLYDSEAVLREIRGDDRSPEPPAEWSSIDPDEAAMPSQQVTPEPLPEPALVSGSDPVSGAPEWESPVDTGHPSKLMHVSSLRPERAAGVETDFFVMTPIDALGTWPASPALAGVGSGGTYSVPSGPAAAPFTPVAPATPTTQDQQPTGVPTARSFPSPAPPAEPAPFTPPSAPEMSVELPDSLLADLLGGGSQDTGASEDTDASEDMGNG